MTAVENQLAVVDAGVVTMAVAAMTSSPELTALQDSGCALLAVLASYPQNRSSIVDGRGIPAIANAIKAVSDMPEVVTEGAWCGQRVWCAFD
jgi:hypothetical protein